MKTYDPFSQDAPCLVQGPHVDVSNCSIVCSVHQWKCVQDESQSVHLESICPDLRRDVWPLSRRVGGTPGGAGVPQGVTLIFVFAFPRMSSWQN